MKAPRSRDARAISAARGWPPRRPSGANRTRTEAHPRGPRRQGEGLCQVGAQKRVFRKIDGDGLINSEGDFWLRQRRLIQKAFLHRRLGHYGKMAVNLTQRRLDRWTEGAAINLDREMSELALEIAGETLFGVDLRDRVAWLGETAEVL